MSKPFREKGLAYIQQGYAIIPIPPGKKGPVFENWETKYANTPERFDELLADSHSRAGIGIIAKFNPAIDIDTLDEEMSNHMIEWVRDNLDDAPVRYGKAPKVLMMFQCEKPFRKITSALFKREGGPPQGERVEILGDGQQFVAEHIHPETGKPYEWPDENPLSIASIDLPVLTIEQAEATCREFERKARELGWELLREGTSANDDDDDGEFDPLTEILPPDETEEEVERVKSALEAMKPNSTDYSYDEWRNVLFALKWTRWECAEDLAREWSESSDKHDPREFRTVWRGAQKRKRNREFTLGTLFEMAKQQGWDASRAVSDEKKEQSLDELLEEADALAVMEKPGRAIKELLRKMAETTLDSIDEGAIFKAIKSATGESIGDLRKLHKEYKTKSDNGSATHAGYTKSLLRILEEKSGTEAVGVEGSLYVYQPHKGIWDGTPAPDFSVRVADEFDGQENCERRSDYLAIANHAYTVAAKDNDDFFNDAPVGLACVGRFYRVNAEGEIEREPLGPQHRQRILSPVRPVVGEMPMFDKFLHETFAGECEKEQIDLLQEIIGATLIGTMATYEKVVLFKGVGRAGKGTLMKIIEAMLPRESRSATNPFNWDNEYYLAALAGKRLNLVGELPDDKPIPASTFKTVVGRDVLQGRHPGGKPFNFKNQAAHIFNTNHFVHTKDHTEAFFNRWILLEFRNSRIGIEGAIEKDLADRIIANELNHIMAWALKGARRVEDRGYFLGNKVQDRMMAQWSRRTSSLMEFMLDKDNCILSQEKGVFTPRAEFYKAYAQWCKESNRFALGKIKAYDEIESAAFQRIGVRMGTNATGRDVIRGVALRKSEWDEHVFGDVDDEL